MKMKNVIFILIVEVFITLDFLHVDKPELDSQFTTIVSIGKTKGKFYLCDDNEDDFWKLYQQKVEQEDEDLSLAEVLPEKDKIRPLLFDIDLSVSFEGVVGQMRTSSSFRQLTSEDQTERETCTRNDFGATCRTTASWSGPKDQPGVILQVGLDPRINKTYLMFSCQFMVLCM